jgi:hypothetical protein
MFVLVLSLRLRVGVRIYYFISVPITHPVTFLLYVAYVSSTSRHIQSPHQWWIKRTQHEANNSAIINTRLILQLTPGQIQYSARSKSLHRMFFLQRKRVSLRHHKTLFKIIVLRMDGSVV